ncbi:MAG: hypothetical protein ACYSYV_11970, partial [Planctomycetota bacterium]
AARLTGQTDINGDAGTDYGPYIQKIPTNQFNDSNAVTIGAAAPGNDATGWYFNTSTGAFHADTADHADL